MSSRSKSRRNSSRHTFARGALSALLALSMATSSLPSQGVAYALDVASLGRHVAAEEVVPDGVETVGQDVGVDDRMAEDATPPETPQAEDAADGEEDVEPTRWTIRLDPNGGKAAEEHALDDVVAVEDEAPVTLTTGLEREGHHLVGWATTKDNASVEDDPKTEADETVVNRFVPTGVALSNLSYRFVELTADEASARDHITLPDGHTIAVVGDAHAAGSTLDGHVVREVTLAEDLDDEGAVTLYAVWSPNTFTVAFDAAGGEGEMAPQEMAWGTKAALRENSFTLDGHEFAGWATQAGGKAAFSDGQEVADLSSEDGATVTLYATWNQLPEPDAQAEGDDASSADSEVPTAEAAAAAAESKAEEGIERSLDLSHASASEDLASVVIGGEAAEDPAIAVRVLQRDLDLGLPQATSVAMSLFAATRDGGEEPEYPRQADGSNIENISARWVTQDTTDDGDADHLYVKLTDDEPTGVRMLVNYALSGEHDYGAGDVTLTIPAYIFSNRTGRKIGKLTLPCAEDPLTTDDFNWKRVGDTYVLTSTRKMSAATKGYFEFSITELVPHTIVDMADSAPFSATIQVVTHRGNTIALDSNEIVAQFDTEEVVDHATKYISSAPHWVEAESIPEELRVDGEEEYVLLSWYMYGHIAGNTEFTLDILDEVPDEYSGFVVSSSPAGTIGADGRTVSVNGALSGWREPANVGFQTVTVAYPGSQFEPETLYTFHNSVTYTLTEADPAVGDDPQKVTTATATAQTSWSWHEPTFTRPTGHFMVNKMGNDGVAGSNPRPWQTHSYRYSSYDAIDINRHNTDDGYGIYPSGLNDIQDGSSVELGYTVESIGYILPWTLKEGGDYRKVGDYMQRPVTMVTYDADDTLESPLWLDGNVPLEVGVDFDYKAVEFPRIPNIGDATAINLQPDGSFIAKHAGDGSVTYVADLDRSHIPDVTLEALVGGEWVDVATAAWSTGSLVLTPSHPEATVDGVRVTLPEGTTQVRTSVESTNAYIYYYIRPIVELYPSAKLQAVAETGFSLSNTPSVGVHNSCYMKAYEDDGTEIVDIHKAAMDKVNGYTTDVWVYPTKTSVQNLPNYNDRTVTVHYHATVEERTVIPDEITYEQALADGRITPEEEGVWYDLLPKGMTPKLDTVSVRSGDRVLDSYTIEDHNGSGRTLLVVKVSLTPTPTRYKNGVVYYYEDTPTISFDALYDFESLRDYGDDPHNVIAFESISRDPIGTVEGYSGEEDDPYGTGNVATVQAFLDDAERDAMGGLDPSHDGARFVYAGTITHVDILSSARTSLSKDLQVNGDGIWGTGTYEQRFTVYEGGQYKYRLRMLSDPDTQSKDLIIYDALECFHAADGNDDADIDAPRWQGTLRSVDVSQLVDKGVAPVVYYSTINELQLSDETDPRVGNPTNLDLDNADVWVRASVYQGSLDDVHAIAIDCRKNADGTDFVLEPLESVSVIVNMHAPHGEPAREYISQKGVWGDSANAYNNAYLTCTSIDVQTGGSDSDNFVRKDYTKVGLVEHPLVATKDWADGDDRDGIRPEGTTVRVYANGEDLGVARDLTDLHDNLLRSDPRPEDPDDPSTLSLDLDEPLAAGSTYTLQLWDVNLDDSSAGVAVYLGGTRVDDGGLVPDASGYAKATFAAPDTVGTDQWVELRSLPEGHGDSSLGAYRWKLEEGAYGSAWLPATADQEDGVDYGASAWKATIDHMPYTDEEGRKISYSVVEDPVEGYASSVVKAGTTFRVVNTHVPERTRVEGEKTWVGDTEDVRPKSVTVQLWKDVAGTSTFTSAKTVTPGADGSWKYSFEDLYKYEAGEEISWRVTERAADSYLAEVDGHDIVNTYHPYGDLELTKTVVGATEAFSGRRFDVMLSLSDAEGLPVQGEYDYDVSDAEGVVLRSGSISNSGTLSIADGETVLVHELPEGITYSFKEQVPDGYTVTQSAALTGTVLPNRVTSASLTNTYRASGFVNLEATKSLTGHAMTRYQFRFQLLDSSGNLLKSGANALDGTVTFGAINYTADDAGKTYTYKVVETDRGKPGYTYDAAEFVAEVAVTDNGDGTLSCDVSYLDAEGQAIDLPAFENSYHAEGSAVLRAWKLLKGGRNLAEGEFAFELLDEEGNVLQTKANDAGGVVTFDAIAYDEEDAGRDFHYAVREVAGDDETVTYDGTTFGYKVSVTDNGDGTLTCSQGYVEVDKRPILETVTWSDVRAAVRAGEGPYYAGMSNNELVVFNDGMSFEELGLYLPAEAFADDESHYRYVPTSDEDVVAVLNGNPVPGCQVFGSLDTLYDGIGERDIVVLNLSEQGASRVLELFGDNYDHLVLMPSTRNSYASNISTQRAWTTRGYETEFGEDSETMPVFTNVLKPGAISITKTVTDDTPDEKANHEFRFHVQLTGEDLPESIEYELQRIPEEEPEPGTGD